MRSGAVTAQTIALSWRAVIRLARQPSTWLPGIAFPLIIVAVNSSAIGRATEIAGFPPDTSYLQFLLPAAIVQGVLFGSIAGGTELATDIQTGFFDRLMSSPVTRPSILFGRLAGATVFGAFQACLFTLVIWAFGAEIRGGLAAVAVLVAVASLLALGAGGFAAGLAARTGQAEVVQSIFPLVFIMLFLSSCFFPTELMNGWYRTVAEANPLTPMVDGIRHQVIVGFDAGEAATSLVIVGVLSVLGMVFALRQLAYRVRVAR